MKITGYHCDHLGAARHLWGVLDGIMLMDSVDCWECALAWRLRICHRWAR